MIKAKDEYKTSIRKKYIERKRLGENYFILNIDLTQPVQRILDDIAVLLCQAVVSLHLSVNCPYKTEHVAIFMKKQLNISMHRILQRR
jgi:hypothetical protein